MKVTDEMVWRFVRFNWPSINFSAGSVLSQQDVRSILEHVLGAEPEPCPCRRCERERGETVHGIPSERTHMTVCPVCGNKRCPHAEYHAYACSGSNAPGQTGEPVPEWSLDKLILRVLAAVEVSAKPPSEEERLRNLRVNLAAELFKEATLEERSDETMRWKEINTTKHTASHAFNAADIFLAEWKRREGK